MPLGFLLRILLGTMIDTPSKIIVIGTSCSGKSSLGRALSKKFDIPWYDFDDLHWLPGWEPRPEEDFLADVAEIASGDQWIFTGNYKSTWPYTWEKADLIIWLDLPLWRLLWRGLRRGLRHIRNNEPLCNGNYDSYRRLFLSRHSIFKWILRGYWKNRRRYRLLIQSTPKLVRFTTEAQVARFHRVEPAL